MKLAIVGVGKLGLALLEGVTGRGVLSGADIGLVDADLRRAAELAERFGARSLGLAELGEVPRVLISVQPRTFPEISGLLGQPNTAYLSTMAGVSTATLARRLGTRRVIRAMPNLAALVGRAQTAITGPAELEGAPTDPGDLDFARTLFGAVGQVYELPEHLFNAFTGLTGSGPAYMALVAEALADGGVRMGLARPLAQELAARLLSASGELLLGRPHPATLKDEVCSPGGTSIAGIAALEASGVRSGLIRAVEAATLRGNELGRDQEG